MVEVLPHIQTSDKRQAHLTNYTKGSRKLSRFIWFFFFRTAERYWFFFFNAGKQTIALQQGIVLCPAPSVGCKRNPIALSLDKSVCHLNLSLEIWVFLNISSLQPQMCKFETKKSMKSQLAVGPQPDALHVNAYLVTGQEKYHQLWIFGCNVLVYNINFMPVYSLIQNIRTRVRSKFFTDQKQSNKRNQNSTFVR